MLGGLSDVVIQIEEDGWVKHPTLHGMYLNVYSNEIATLNMIMFPVSKQINPFGKILP